jgi:DNA-binding MarR family transcriptional regulator
VALTDSGKKIIKQAVKAVEKFDREFFAVLGDKTADFNKKLVTLLKQQ